MNSKFPDTFGAQNVAYNTLMRPVWERRQALLADGKIGAKMDAIIAHEFPNLQVELKRVAGIPNLKLVPQTSVIVREVLDITAAYNTLMRPVWERRQELLKEGKGRQMDEIISQEFPHIGCEIERLKKAA